MAGYNEVHAGDVAVLLASADHGSVSFPTRECVAMPNRLIFDPSTSLRRAYTQRSTRLPTAESGLSMAVMNSIISCLRHAEKP